jgi:hypothetical protein
MKKKLPNNGKMELTETVCEEVNMNELAKDGLPQQAFVRNITAPSYLLAK